MHFGFSATGCIVALFVVSFAHAQPFGCENASTGLRLWERELLVELKNATTRVLSTQTGIVFSGTFFAAFNVSSGEIFFSSTCRECGVILSVEEAFDGVLVLRELAVQLIKLSGSEVWRRPLPGPTTAKYLQLHVIVPALDAVAVFTTWCTLHTISLRDGRILASTALPSCIQLAPTASSLANFSLVLLPLESRVLAIRLLSEKATVFQDVSVNASIVCPLVALSSRGAFVVATSNASLHTINITEGSLISSAQVAVDDTIRATVAVDLGTRLRIFCVTARGVFVAEERNFVWSNMTNLVLGAENASFKLITEVPNSLIILSQALQDTLTIVDETSGCFWVVDVVLRSVAFAISFTNIGAPPCHYTSCATRKQRCCHFGRYELPPCSRVQLRRRVLEVALEEQ